LPHGKGELVNGNGDTYFGDIQYGFRHGKGTLRYANGNIYEGEWKNDMQNGLGKFTLPSNPNSPFPNEY
jgi:hypothetical protein